MTKKKTSKNNFLGFRLSQELIDRLDLFAKQVNKSRGLIAKDALKQWINQELLNQTNEMITIPKSLLMQLFGTQEENLILDYANSTSDLFADLLRFLLSKPMNKENLEEYIRFINRFFGKNGLKWFNTLDFNIKDDFVLIKGLHDIDENFSLFYSHLIQSLLESHFNLQLKEISNKSSSNLVYLEIKIKK